MEQDRKTPGERALELIRLLLPNWQQPRQEVLLRWIRIAIAVGVVILGVLLILDVVSSFFGIKHWNVLKVLAVPITVGAAVPWLNRQQKKREQEGENQRAQDEALQAYLNQMSQLLIDKERPLHRAVRGDELSTVARAWTLTVLDTLDSSRLKGLEPLDSGRRKRRVVKFLYEAKLICADGAIVRLSKVNLNGADLREADLSNANLSAADLSGADLSGADLRGADLSEAILNGAVLKGAQLGTARQIVVLPDGGAEPAEPNPANLRQAVLNHTDLTKATGWTHEQLDRAKSLNGAIMPDGHSWKDWIERGWLKGKKAARLGRPPALRNGSE